MKRSIPFIVALIVIGAAAYKSYQPVPNPDPSHTHADFAVWIDGTQIDFSKPEFMSEAYDPTSNQPLRVHPLRTYLHLHDGNGHVIHRHKPGLTLGEFFLSISHKLEDGVFYACGLTECVGMGGEVQMYVNGTGMEADGSYVFSDEDKILITNAKDTAMIQDQIAAITNDACRYSQTCPWRGAPPMENCIADPEVPCVIPD